MMHMKTITIEVSEPTSVGKVLKPLGPDDDTLGEMLNDLRG